MSAINKPTAVAALPVMVNPQPSLPPNNQPSHPQQTGAPSRHPIPPFVNIRRLRDVERRARQEITLIEHEARVAARCKHPMEPLPRTQSNKLSVKRTREIRKQVEDRITKKILAKFESNRRLDELIEIEKEKHRRLKEEIAELEKLPDIQQELVQFEEETLDQITGNFITNLDLYNTPETENDFDLAVLANSLLECRPFAGANGEANDSSADCEPTLNLKYILPSNFSEDFQNPFAFDDEDETF